MFARRALVLASMLLAGGCTGASTVATAPPSATTQPTATSASAAPATSSSAASQTNAATPNPNGWQLLTNFPTNGAAQVNSIVFAGGAFVAVGTAANQNAACAADTNHGRVWTSADGLSWTSQVDDAFAQTDLTAIFSFGGALYALGSTGSLDEPTPCASAPRPAGINVWRSADGGATWQQLPQSQELLRASAAKVIVAGSRLLAVGSIVDADGNEHAATWTSTDATAWTAAELPPTAPHLANAAARGDVYVAFGDDQESPLPWISRDDGAHWYEESVDVPAATASDLQLTVEDVTATDSRYIAVGDGCCIGSAQLVPIAFTTPDGTQWHGGVVGGDQTEKMLLIDQLPNGLLAVGIQTYVDPAADRSSLGGRSWTSADGTAWQAGPTFAELGDGNVTALAIGPTGVVVAGATFLDEPQAGADTGLRIWYAPVSAFPAGASH